MQDPSTAFQSMKPHFPEQEQVKCPRCESTNTKFCYYNNYNLSQPRHFCKNCRRYWTKGGALRNIPVGGGSRKGTKRSSNPKRDNPEPNPDPGRTSRRLPDSSSSSSTTTTIAATSAPAVGGGNLGSDQVPIRIYGLEIDQDRKILDMGGSFGSLLATNGQFGSSFEGLNPSGLGLKMVQMGGFGEDLKSDLNVGSGRNPGLDVQGGSNNSGGGSGPEGYLQSGDWGGKY